MAPVRTLAHISDLHIGRSAATERRAQALCARLVKLQVDHVVVTGDVTHRGRHAELDRFEEIFAPLLARKAMSVVPGNHDRIGDENAGARLMPDGQRVAVDQPAGLHVVRFDSTGPHNRAWAQGHGLMTVGDIADVIAALNAAPAGRVCVLLLHHHVLPYPHDNSAEWLVSFLGYRIAVDELPLGRDLLQAIRGRCDLVLHGHRHNPGTATVFGADARPLSLFNAGSTTGLGQMRLFSHAAGRLQLPSRWVDAAAAEARGQAPREHVLAF